MDGELARLSGKSSRFGYHFDNYSDAVIHVALFLCIGIRPAGELDRRLGALARPDRRAFRSRRCSSCSGASSSAPARARPASRCSRGIHLEDTMYFIGPITWGGGLIVLLFAGVGARRRSTSIWLVWKRAAGTPVRQATGDAGMTTLVTGATGFLGSAVARKLLDAGHAVRVLDAARRRHAQHRRPRRGTRDRRPQRPPPRWSSAAKRLRYAVSRGGRLSPVDPRSAGDLPHQRGRLPRPAARCGRRPGLRASSTRRASPPWASTPTTPRPTRKHP